eukprot:gnl/TRDRNA2_/TRDRNA2_84780_c0_seq1.p1 gnl/TRDRNA2_/TRDRNA2_84780_c0~~gnl/TRDRNA2_/TRDRNA2_84780_c0_seq1.p1  ORF type:complete len:555 (+),score=87.98 gnl/TRDRNA2_/TRDRNA2_84780_c0_seq1:58-1665(+)
MAAPTPLRPWCSHGSVIHTLVAALAFSACAHPQLPSLRGRATPVPEALRKPTGTGPAWSGQRAQFPAFKADLPLSVAPNAKGNMRQELTSTEEDKAMKTFQRKKISERIAGLLWSRKPGGQGLEKQLRDFLFAKARVFTSAGDLTTIYGFIPVVTQLLVLSDQYNCMDLTNPKSAVPAGLAFVSRVVQLQYFSVVLLGVSLSQLVVGTRETLKTQDILFGRDPFCLDLWFPIGFNARPGGARIIFRKKDEPRAKPRGVKNLAELLSLVTKSEGERRRLQFFFKFRDEITTLSEETADILIFGTALSFVAIIGAIAPYLAYVGVGVRDAHLAGGTDLSVLATLNLRLATSQFAIAVAGVTSIVAGLSQASPEVRSEFKDDKKAGVLVAETVKLVDDLKMPDFMAKSVLPNVLASALFLVFSIDGLGQSSTMEVTGRACTAVKDVGAQVKVMSRSTFGGTDAAKLIAVNDAGTQAKSASMAKFGGADTAKLIAVKDAGTQANSISMPKFGGTDTAKRQANFDFDAKGTARNVFLDET